MDYVIGLFVLSMFVLIIWFFRDAAKAKNLSSASTKVDVTSPVISADASATLTVVPPVAAIEVPKTDENTPTS